MKRKILWAFLIIWLILTAYLLFLSNKWASAATPSYAASSAVTTDNFAELLRETLQKNPDLLLSVLRENSEAVLDIAQEGSNQRRHKSLIAQWKAELNQPKEVDIKDRPFRGAADAPVTIVAYSDFTCPYCQQAAGTMERSSRKIRARSNTSSSTSRWKPPASPASPPNTTSPPPVRIRNWRGSFMTCSSPAAPTCSRTANPPS